MAVTSNHEQDERGPRPARVGVAARARYCEVMRPVKMLALALTAIVLLTCGWLLNTWHRATQLPDWATQTPTAPPASDGVAGHRRPGVTAPGLRWVEIETEGGKAAEASQRPQAKQRPRRKPKEIRNFHVQMLMRGDPLQPAVRGSRATFKAGELEAGVILDVDAIDYTKMRSKDRASVRKALSMLGLSGRKVYLGLRDRPLQTQGMLQVSNDARIEIGKSSHSLAWVARRVGVSPSRLRRQINTILRNTQIRHPDAA